MTGKHKRDDSGDSADSAEDNVDTKIGPLNCASDHDVVPASASVKGKMTGKHKRDDSGDSADSAEDKVNTKNRPLHCANDHGVPASASVKGRYRHVAGPSKTLRKSSSNGGSGSGSSSLSLSSDQEGNGTSVSGGTTRGNGASARQEEEHGPLARHQTSITMSSASSGATMSPSTSDAPQWSERTRRVEETTTTATSDSACSASSSQSDGQKKEPGFVAASEVSFQGHRSLVPSTVSGRTPPAPRGAKKDASYDMKAEDNETKVKEHIMRPHANDVLCGRGRGFYSHSGNIKFQEFVQERKEEYILAPTKEDKNRIAREIIERVHGLDPPGRFLVQCSDRPAEGAEESSSKYWLEIDREKMFAKTSQALREGAPPVRATAEKLLIDTHLHPSSNVSGTVTNSSAPEAALAKSLQSRSAASSTGQDGADIDKLSSDQLRALSMCAIKESGIRRRGHSDLEERQRQQQDQENQAQQQQERQTQLPSRNILLGAQQQQEQQTQLPSRNIFFGVQPSPSSALPQLHASNAAASLSPSIFQQPTHNLRLYQDTLRAVASARASNVVPPAIPSTSPFPQQTPILFGNVPSSAPFAASQAYANQIALQQAMAASSRNINPEAVRASLSSSIPMAPNDAANLWQDLLAGSAVRLLAGMPRASVNEQSTESGTVSSKNGSATESGTVSSKNGSATESGTVSSESGSTNTTIEHNKANKESIEEEIDKSKKPKSKHKKGT